jgi:hypothetical protein
MTFMRDFGATDFVPGGFAMPEEICIHHFQTEDGEWLCAVQEPNVHSGKAMAQRFRDLLNSCETPIPGAGDEHIVLMARIAIHHAMERQDGMAREFKLEFLPPVVKVEVPSSGIGKSLLNLFEGVTVWRKSA